MTNDVQTDLFIKNVTYKYFKATLKTPYDILIMDGVNHDRIWRVLESRIKNAIEQAGLGGRKYSLDKRFAEDKISSLWTCTITTKIKVWDGDVNG